MKITISAPQQTARQMARSLGYAEFDDPNTGQISYTRRLSSNFYPRFHLYIEEKKGQMILNLHLDQKQVSYQGHTAHSGEYNGELVEQEGERIKQEISKYACDGGAVPAFAPIRKIKK
ncbi:MAG: hypothetical protein HZC05_01245 [Candidatus Magasanikbacteria bacterium]|nr:hypothetical protein [Candidatus Magasanikbacteria bacterium]